MWILNNIENAYSAGELESGSDTILNPDVEDSPAAFEHVMHFNNCKVAIFNRPWNINEELPSTSFTRCADWQEIDRCLEGCAGEG